MNNFLEYDRLKKENEKLKAEIDAIDKKILKELMRTNICSKVKNLVNNWSGNRIDWDDYFMSIAHLASSRSPCERLHVGCVLVKDNRLVSMASISAFSFSFSLFSLSYSVSLSILPFEVILKVNS